MVASRERFMHERPAELRTGSRRNRVRADANDQVQ
jgi:hypothetical protein